MKKIIIIVSMLLVILCSIILITHLASNNNDSNIDKASDILYINHNIKKIDKMEVYYGDETYYIAYFNKDDKNYIGVLDNDYKLIVMDEKELLKNIDETKNKDYKIGYKYDKLVYEVKKENKDGYIYLYYDALSGEFIKKINMDR